MTGASILLSKKNLVYPPIEHEAMGQGYQRHINRTIEPISILDQAVFQKIKYSFYLNKYSKTVDESPLY